MKYFKSISIFIVSLTVLSACINYDYTDPDKKVYLVDFESNTTIRELVQMYDGGLTKIEEDVIIKGTVIANDKSGNFYKEIMIQDSTSGIAIGLNAYELHNTFGIGDLVYIKCKGLYLGQYGGVVKLGMPFEGEIGRINEPLIDDYLYKSDGGEPIEPSELFLAPVNGLLLNKLVVINDVQFALSALGNTYADREWLIDGEYYLEDCDGNRMLVRTSGYSDFAGDTIAEGNGQMLAVLTSYNEEFQLIIRDVNEINFSGNRCGAIFEETFDGNLGSFNPYSVIGDDQVWEYSSQFDCAVMTGFDNGDNENEDWLISPAIDLSIYTDVVLNFRHTFGYFTSFDDMKVFICDDFDGSNPSLSGTWVELTGFEYPEAGSFWDWTDSGDIDISAYSGKSEVFIAFKYVSTDFDACTWEVDQISISAN